MLQIVADTHTHTMACDHAFSTLRENIEAASAKGLRFLATTEHATKMPGAPSMLYFGSLRTLPRKMKGVILLKGAEVNIMDYEGGMDLPDNRLKHMEWVIASMHEPCLKSGAKADHTQAWLCIAANPHVDVMGHMGDARYEFDHETVVRELAKAGKIVEINAHSFRGRRGSRENCPAIARLCMRYGVPVVVSSDAHIWSDVGRFGPALDMLEEIGFPEELVLNADYHRFLELARRLSGKELTDEPDLAMPF